MTKKFLVPIVLNGDPTAPLEAATKQYVDANAGGGATGTKMTDLTAQTGANAVVADIIEVVDLSDTTMAASGTNKKMTLAELIAFLNANGIGGGGDVELFDEDTDGIVPATGVEMAGIRFLNANRGWSAISVATPLMVTPPGAPGEDFIIECGQFNSDAAGAVPGSGPDANRILYADGQWFHTADLTTLTGAQAATGDLITVLDISDTALTASGLNKQMTLVELAAALDNLFYGLGDLAGLNEVNTSVMGDNAVNNAKLENMVQSTIKGRTAGTGTGDPVDLTAAQTKTILAITGADIATDSVTNTQLATMPTLTVKGNATGSTSGPTDITIAALRTLLGITDQAVMSVPGTVAVVTGALRYYFNKSVTVTNVRMSVGTAPTGATLIADLNKNGTTIFTTQGNRPTIAIGANTDATSVPDVTSFVAGDYMTVDIDQVGSTVAGANLTMQVEFTYA